MPSKTMLESTSSFNDYCCNSYEVNVLTDALSRKKMTVGSLHATEEEDSLTEVTASLSSLDDDEEDGFALLTPAPTPERPSSRKRLRMVRFGMVEIRHYGRTVDDHPCAVTGPALTLTWDVQQTEAWTMEEFEGCRTSTSSGNGLRRLSPQVRKSMLLREWNVPHQELRNAMYLSQYIQRQRRETLYDLQRCYMQESPSYEDESLEGYDHGTTSGGHDDCREDYNACGSRCSLANDWDAQQQHPLQEVGLVCGHYLPTEEATMADCYVDAEEEVEPHLLAYHY